MSTFIEARRSKLLEDRLAIIRTLTNETLKEHGITKKDKEYQKILVDKQINIEKLIQKKLSVAKFDQIVGYIVRRNVRGWVGWEDFLGADEHD